MNIPEYPVPKACIHTEWCGQVTVALERLDPMEYLLLRY